MLDCVILIETKPYIKVGGEGGTLPYKCVLPDGQCEVCKCYDKACGQDFFNLLFYADSLIPPYDSTNSSLTFIMMKFTLVAASTIVGTVAAQGALPVITFHGIG